LNTGLTIAQHIDLYMQLINILNTSYALLKLLHSLGLLIFHATQLGKIDSQLSQLLCSLLILINATRVVQSALLKQWLDFI